MTERLAQLPAISLWQPWATLTAKGRRYETRDWSPSSKKIGQLVAIHAGKRSIGKDLHGQPLTAEFRAEVTTSLKDPDWMYRLPMGAYVATAVLTGAFRCGKPLLGADGKRMVQVVERVAGSDSSVYEIEADPFGDFSPGRWAWRFERAEAILPPVPGNGRQGWWTWQHQWLRSVSERHASDESDS